MLQAGIGLFMALYLDGSQAVEMHDVGLVSFYGLSLSRQPASADMGVSI